MNDTPPPVELASLIDAHGHKVTVLPAGLRDEMAVILTATAGRGLAGGQPTVNRDMARELGEALTAFADGGGT
jgi:hypothetical protein